jgi:hypothetical protein
MLDQIFKVKQFFVPKGETVEAIFASDLSLGIKTHSVKVRGISGENRYIIVPCQSGASGQLPCKFCSKIDEMPEYIYRPRKIFVATIYVKAYIPWEDNNKNVHYYYRNLYVTSTKIKEKTVDPYIKKYGSLVGAKFNIVRGEESTQHIGDLYNFIGFIPDVASAIQERVNLFDPQQLFSPLTQSEVDEVFQLIQLARASDNMAKSMTKGPTIKAEPKEQQPIDTEDIPF